MAGKLSTEKSIAAGVLSNCDLCHFPSWSNELSSDEHEISLESFAEVNASAEKGCTGCELLLHAWQYAIPETNGRQSSTLNFNKSNDDLWIHIFTKSGVHNIEIFTLFDAPSFKHVGVAGLLPQSTSLEHNLPRIQSWVSECQESHSTCIKSTSYVPLRLLDVELDNPSVVRLVEMPCAPAITHQYACLSHCWGNTRSTHITHTANLSTNMAGIPISELPKTFRDAIDISRALKLRYLWIDSLCIVQNSESDWAKHVDVMASIYENAFITLAAGASRDDDGGFFTVLSKRLEEPRPQILDTGGQPYIVYMRRSIDHPDAEWPSVTCLPLMERGWCFQERLLSSRFLCFGSHEVIWECLEEVACPCSMAAGPFNSRAVGTAARFKNCPATKARIFSQDANYTSLWRSLVTEYSSRQLTYPKDKLPALAGLATTFQRKFETSSYTHGHWISSLEKDLAWQVEGAAPLARSRTGPSWSWAYGSDNPIDWPDLCATKYHQLLGVVERLESDGRVASMLSLTGVLLAISLQTWTEKTKFEQEYSLTRYCRVIQHGDIQYTSQFHYTESANLQYPPLSGSHDTSNSDEKEDIPYQTLRGHFFADFKFWESENDLQHQLQRLVFFALGVENDGDSPSNGSESKPHWVAGMVLRPVNKRDGASTTDIVEQFERIGWLRYCLGTTDTKFVPAGAKAKFLLV